MDVITGWSQGQATFALPGEGSYFSTLKRRVTRTLATLDPALFYNTFAQRISSGHIPLKASTKCNGLAQTMRCRTFAILSAAPALCQRDRKPSWNEIDFTLTRPKPAITILLLHYLKPELLISKIDFTIEMIPRKRATPLFD